MIKAKIVHILLILCFVCQQAGLAQSLNGPVAVGPVLPADSFQPLLLRSLQFDPAKGTLRFSAINAHPEDQDDRRKAVEYFKTGLQLPNESFWVNLRPDNPDQMLDQVLENTEVGRILLEADVQLKKDLASMTDPDTILGRQYWQAVYAKAESLFAGDEETEIPAVTRPWIVPGEIIIAESPLQTSGQAAGAFICKATLEVRLEQDHLSGQSEQFSDPRLKLLNEYASEQIRSSIIPALTRQVNSSKRYAALRQVLSALILAQWVKERYPGLRFSFADAGAAPSAWSKMDYFRKYQESLRQGEYNKDETLRRGSSLIVRHYASGGIQVLHASRDLQAVPTHQIQRFLSAMPGSVELPEVAVEVGARDGGMTQGQIEGVLEDVIGLDALNRVRVGGGSDGYAMFLQAVQDIPEMNEKKLAAFFGDIASLVGKDVFAECLYDGPSGLAMLIERLSHPQSMKLFVRLCSLLGTQAAGLAMLRDSGYFAGMFDSAASVGEDAFAAAIEQLFRGKGLQTVSGLLARQSHVFAELVAGAAADKEKADLIAQAAAKHGEAALNSVMSIASAAFTLAVVLDKDTAAVDKLFSDNRESLDLHDGIAAASEEEFIRRLDQVSNEQDIDKIGVDLRKLFGLRDILYPDAAGLVELEKDKPVLLVPDVHSRRRELWAILQQKDGNGRTNLEKILAGQMQLVILGDLVHSEDHKRWLEIEQGLDAEDDRPLSAEITDGLGTVEMVLLLKSRLPRTVHWLQGNHDQVNQDVRKFISAGGEGRLVRQWISRNFGSEFVSLYAALENNLPLMAVGNDFIASHSDPDRQVRPAQILMKSDDAVEALTWARTNGRYSRDMLGKMLGSDKGLYIVGHTPQANGINDWQETEYYHLLILNDQDALQYLVIDSQQVMLRGQNPIWNFNQARQFFQPAYQPAISHEEVNAYIRENIPEILYEKDIGDPQIQDILRQAINRFRLVGGYGANARVIPVKGLLAATGLFGHIGLGQVYGQPVVYVDEDYQEDTTVLGHELYEIAKWEALRKEKELEGKKFEAGQMRQWIKDNLAEARQLAEEWHGQAPSLDALSARAGLERREAFHNPYAEDDILLGARQSRLDDYYNWRHPMTDIVRYEADGLSVYQEGNGIVYKDLVSTRRPLGTRKAVARIYRYGRGYGRLIAIYTRADVPVTDDLVIALAKIGEGFNGRRDNPRALGQQEHQQRIAQLEKEDTGKVFGKNRVLVNGRYYYTEQGKLASMPLEGLSILKSKEAVRRLINGERINNSSLSPLLSRLDAQIRVEQENIRLRRRERQRLAQGQTVLEDFNNASRDGGKKQIAVSIEDYVATELGISSVVDVDMADEDLTGKISAAFAYSGQAKAVKLDLSNFKPGGLLGAQSVVDSYRLIRGRIWDIGEALRPVFNEARDMESADRPSFAVEELIKNAFVHGNDGNFDLPIYLAIDIQDGRFKQASVMDMAAYKNTELADASVRVYAKPERIIHDHKQATGLLTESWDYRGGDGNPIQPQEQDDPVALERFALDWKGQTFGIATVAARDGGSEAIEAAVEDYIAANFGRNTVVPVDLQADNAGGQIIEALLNKQGQAVRLDLSGFKPAPGALMGSTVNFADLNEKFGDIAGDIQIAMHLDFDSKRANNVSFAVEELLKNAFVHGSKTNFDLPIYMMIDMENKSFRSLRVVDMAVSENSQFRVDESGLFYAINAGLNGFGQGIKWLSPRWNFIYGSGSADNHSFVVRWKDQAFGMAAIESRDGGNRKKFSTARPGLAVNNLGGVDFRRLRSRNAAVSSEAQHKQIEQFFSENKSAQALELQAHLSRCRDVAADSGTEQEQAIACVLRIMRSEESLAVPSHPGLIAVLSQISSS